MLAQKYLQLPVLRTLDAVKVFVLLAITIWIAHFWHSASFGLYADDYIFVSRPMMMSGAEFWSYIQRVVSSPLYGRPIGYTLVALFSFLGGQLAGLQGVYWIAFVIVTVNSILFYALLKRLFTQQVFALTGALAFALFPADTTHAFLTHMHVYPSLTFLLIALHCYLSGRIKLSYLIILGSLLSYETVFPVFLAAPLLKKKWDARLMRELIRHALVLGVMIVCVVIIRKALGEPRVTNLDIFSTIKTPILHMIKGPITSMKMFLYRPLDALRSLQGEMLVLLSLFFAGLTWVLSRLQHDISGDALRRVTSIETKVFHVEGPNFFKYLAKLALIGFIMLVLAYPLTLNGPVTEVIGRGSRVHLAAVVGSSILFACVCLAILFSANLYRKKHLATVGLSIFFALLVGSGLTVQKSYKMSWQYQQAFWTDLTQLCPDMTNQTVILIEQTGLQNPKQMDAYSWATSFGLQQIYEFKPNHQFSVDDLKLKPLVYLLSTGWQKKIVSDDNSFELNKFTTKSLSILHGKVDRSKVIFIETKSGKLTRRTEPLIIGCQEYPLKEKSAPRFPPFQKGHLYSYLIRSPHEEQTIISNKLTE